MFAVLNIYMTVVKLVERKKEKNKTVPQMSNVNDCFSRSLD